MSIERTYYFTKYSALYNAVENVLDNYKKEVIFEYSYITNEFFKASQAISSFFSKHKLWKKLKLTRSYAKRVIIIKRRD